MTSERVVSATHRKFQLNRSSRFRVTEQGCARAHVLQCDPEFDLRDIASSVVSNDTLNFSLIGPTVSEL